MTSNISDSLIDAQLRGVPIPAGLLGRLRAIAAPADGELDRQLREVAPPAGLNDRLRDVVEGCWIDETLRDVEAPPVCRVRLRAIPHQRKSSPAGALALAVCVMLAVGAYFGAVGGVLVSLRGRPAPQELLVIDEGPVKIFSARQPAATAAVQVVADSAPAYSEDTALVAFVSEPRLMHFADRVEPGAFAELWSDIDSDGRLWEDIWRLRWNVLGAGQFDEADSPRLERAAPPEARGVEPPLTPGYDRGFLHTHGALPVIYPAAHRALQKQTAPLSVDTRSFELTERLAGEGRLPEAEQLRVEEFLAAMGRQFPAPPDALGIRTACGPSPFGHRLSAAGVQLRPQLMQVGVKAGALSRHDEPGHLVIAVDVSASMKWDGRLETTRRALVNLLEFMHPDDRLSLVLFNEHSTTPFEQVDSEDARQIRQIFSRLQADGGTNLAGGLRQAISAALNGIDGRQSTRLALITDNFASLPPEQRDQVREMVNQSARQGVQFMVVDLGDDVPNAPGALDADSIGGEGDFVVRRPQTSREVLWTLVEALAGKSPVVAADAELEVYFNPDAVAAYRLIGHEANALAAVSASPISADLRAEEEAAVLVEIWLHENDEDDVALAEASYIDPHSGEWVRKSQRISRLQFATSTAGSPLSLQAAVLAAEMGEILHKSPFSPGGPEAIERVLQAAERVDPRLQRRSEFRRFLSLVRRIHDLQTGRDRE